MTERGLVRCLADAEKGNDAALRRWLDTTPDAEVITALRAVTSRAEVSRIGLWAAPISCILFGLTIWASLHQKESETAWIPVAFSFLTQIRLLFCGISSWRMYMRMHKGRSAVLYRAERGDTQALPLLTGYYRKNCNTKNNWTVKVEKAFTDLLDKALEDTQSPDNQPLLYEMVEDVAQKRPLHKAKRDLALGQTYIMVAATRLLARIGGWKNRGLLHDIAKRPAPDELKLPNRRLIYDCVVQCLAPPLISSVTGTPIIAIGASVTAPTTATAFAEPQMQMTGRH